MQISPKFLWTWIPISAVVFLAACWLSTGWQPSQSQTRTAVLTSTDTGAPKDVIARGWIESNHVSYGEKIPFWITFVNASDHEIQDLRLLSFHTPGFKPAPRLKPAPGAKPTPYCWTSSKPPLPSCIEGAPSFPTSLKSGAAVTLSAELEATSPPGRYGLSAVFSWRNPRGERARKALLLGPVEVTYPLADSIFPITQKAYAAGKDFGLPLAVAVLTFFLGFLEQARKEDREAAEKQRKDDLEAAEKRHKEEQEAAEKKHREEQERAEEVRRTQEKLAEEHRAQVQQTWSQLLQKHIQDSQLYYMPMVGKLAYLQSRASLPQPDVRECFYWFMAFMRRVKHTADSIGGVHWKSQRAEKVFSSAWATFRDAAERRLGKAERAKALDSMRPNESPAEFEATLAVEKDLFEPLEKKLGEWLKDPDDPFSRYLCLAQIIQLVLGYEANRPLQHWYVEPLEFPDEELTKALGQLQELRGFTDPWEVRKKLKAYIEAEQAVRNVPKGEASEENIQ